MNLVHDIAESVVGDITPPEFSGVDTDVKSKLEQEGLKKLLDHLPQDNEAKDLIHTLWMDYEHNRNKEALVSHQLDKLEMIIQAYEYERDQVCVLDGFYKSLQIDQVNPWTKMILSEILRRREQMFKKWEQENIKPRVCTRKK